MTPEARRSLSPRHARLPIGTVLHVIHSTRIANLAEVRAWRLAGAVGSIDVQFMPVGNKDMTVRAAPSDAPPAPGQNQPS
jgi:hypothetical protein